MIQNNKKEIRREILSARRALGREFVSDSSEKICEGIMQLPEYREADAILGYFSTQNEPVLDILFGDAIFAGRRVYLPRVEDRTRMEFYHYEGRGDISEGAFGIMEPVSDEAFDPNGCSNILMIMPGVAFDKEGDRIGYGGGYYDRYLAEMLRNRSHFRTVMAAYEMQRVERIPAEDTDIRPDMIITEKGMV